MKMTSANRQKIIDDYLADSGQNMFSASEFIDWLAEKPKHIAYPWFFNKDDESAAREYRIGLARRMASGLRIITHVSTAPATGSVVHITVRELPMFVSPMASRHEGGGYQPVDPQDEAQLAEIRRQSGTALRAWLRRYSGALAASGVDIGAVEQVAIQIEGSAALSA